MDITINQQYINTGGDQISHYYASFYKYNPTLNEFVNWILTNNPMEWGCIRGTDFWTQYVKYSHGKIEYLCENYNKIKDNKIILTRMDGGWTAMDYTIKFE